MNKESILKKLNEIKELANDDKKFKYKNIVNFNCEYIKKELEAIKNTDVIDNYTSLKNYNANFNEALECLECLYCEPEDYRSNDRAKDYETIKNYILKTQESDKYLKWEDLEFSEELKVLNVRMNNNDYILRYALDIFGGNCCFLYDSARNHHIDLTRQFFNDLHLEVLE